MLAKYQYRYKSSYFPKLLQGDGESSSTVPEVDKAIIRNIPKTLSNSAFLETAQETMKILADLGLYEYYHHPITFRCNLVATITLCRMLH
jgi:hypothetical protein